ncbi:MAG TPA: hypothetical protein VFS43_21665 [Polyangiaceae bacterium]|nr:hypothetical protein [Polyangiaceae bacterium]
MAKTVFLKGVGKGGRPASSAETGRALARQERRAASARLARRAGGCALAAGVETAALEMRRCLHRDALTREASRELVVGREHLRRVAATLGPSRPGAEERDDCDAYGGALASEMVGGAA